MNDFITFTNKYPLSKTLRFLLIPTEDTKKSIQKDGVLENDQRLAESYSRMKKTIDEYHKEFIDTALSGQHIDITRYCALYFNKKRTEAEEKELTSLQACLRKEIAAMFSRSEVKDVYNNLFKKELLQKDLPNWIEKCNRQNQSCELYWDSGFEKFTTYFTGFNDNRKNMYTAEEKSTAIAYRLINENLPRYLDNSHLFEEAYKVLHIEINNMFEALQRETGRVYGEGDFSPEAFSNTLTQGGIDAYNLMLQGKSFESGERLQGLNEQINLYNQKNPQRKLARLKPLYKQILSDRNQLSFIPDNFHDDIELLDAIGKFYTDTIAAHNLIQHITNIISSLNQYNTATLYINNKNYKALNDISVKLFGQYSVIANAMEHYYVTFKNPVYEEHLNSAKSESTRDKLIKAKKAYMERSAVTVAEVQLALDAYVKELDHSDVNRCVLQGYSASCIADYFAGFCIADRPQDDNKKYTMEANIEAKYNCVKGIINTSHEEEYKLTDKNKADIKAFLDALMELYHFVQPLYIVDGKNADNKNEHFYGIFDPMYEELSGIRLLYDKVRNYLTKKPYSTSKIKLNFSCPTLLDGWDLNKEKNNLGVMLFQEGKYYLAIMKKKASKAFNDAPVVKPGEPVYRKMVYKLLPGPNKMLPKVFFSKKGQVSFNPPADILEIYNRGSFKKGDNFNIEDCRCLIDFYKRAIEQHEDWSKFEFKFTDTQDYKDISEFYGEISRQGYKLTFTEISAAYVDDLVAKGNMYLFQIYAKDFSEYSHGKENLHTMYFKALFAPQNLQNPVYKLNGEAEIFYRPASLEKKVTHPKGMPIALKNPLHKGESRTFEYDLYKDKRYTEDKFFLHLPITLNCNADGKDNINLLTRQYIKNNPDVNIIGIDRGERNLLYIALMNQKGEIIKDDRGTPILKSLNDIVSELTTREGKVKSFTTPYHCLLDNREKQRAEARENWTVMENIKELKEGYISQVVHYIATLMVKYNAVVVLEDLNPGFKRGRIKIEKQVYQKFEKMLIDKLNYLVFKDSVCDQPAGLYKALQLTSKFESFKKNGKQTGFIFYVPAWNTSKIDPATGFVNLLKPKYTNLHTAKEFFEKFDSIRYNRDKDYFEFAFDYQSFGNSAEGSRTKWTVCTFGSKRYAFNRHANNGRGGMEPVNVTEKLKELLCSHTIDYKSGGDLRKDIAAQNNAGFFAGILKCLSIVLQMRYSCDDEDFILSPVKNKNGEFFCSEGRNDGLPQDADANGAYHIAKKGIWMLRQINEADDLFKVKLAISNKEWLGFVQGEN